MYRQMRVVKSQLSHCLAVFEAMADARHAHRLTDLAQRLDAPKSSVQRLLEHLAAEGWVEQDPSTEQYRLTLRLAVLGQRFMQTAGIADATDGILRNVARQTAELVRLTLVDDDRLVWIGSAQGAPPGLVYQPSMGGRIVSYATANGKAWLATLTDEEACRIALRDGLGQPSAEVGPRALTTIEGLVGALARVRAQGFATAEEEAEAGVAAVAVAVIDPATGRALGATSVAGPVMRLSPARRPAMVAALTAAATELARVWPLRRPQQETLGRREAL
ncbi:IclR family transcriptional regulator [Prosthecomicrobium hirschii]|uniref:IclR family transcriptional regulator n=1 Tax=Prosthecodimorpha hirschii TaxID=665126 RepID=UPI00221F0A47|nr:IclR family transcriptional regulator C-terminal domain-containing protein [Prosthecomicrobium hirschii]MCW1841047.1 helix-turn-helix domain-containing protein [Prosthecomicrobium hirschii]